MKEEEVRDYMAFDTPRIWATQATLVINGPLAMLIFREMANVSTEEQDQVPVNVSKNVASILLPVQVAQELGKIIQNILGDPGSTPPVLDGLPEGVGIIPAAMRTGKGD